MGLFDRFKKKEEEEEIKIVDPEIEKLREEKFNIPVIEDEEEEKPAEVIRRPNPATTNLPNYGTKKNTSAHDTPYSLYKSREIISPMKGRTEKKVEVEEKVKPAKKKVVYNDSDSLTPVISPMFGQNIKRKQKEVKEAVEKVEEAIEEVEVVQEVKAKINPAPKKTKREVQREEEQMIQDAIVEQKTGEYKFNFPDETKKEDSLMNEVEDEMTLEELLTLYEKKK